MKLDEKEGGAVECTNPAKATGTRKRPATKKASPPTSKVGNVVMDNYRG